MEPRKEGDGKNKKKEKENKKNIRDGGEGPVLKYNRVVDRSKETGRKKDYFFFFNKKKNIH